MKISHMHFHSYIEIEIEIVIIWLYQSLFYWTLYCILSENENDLNSPKSVSDEHRPRSEDAQGGVIILGHELEVIGVFPLPLGATILKPNFDLENESFVEAMLFRRKSPTVYLSLGEFELF